MSVETAHMPESPAMHVDRKPQQSERSRDRAGFVKLRRGRLEKGAAEGTLSWNYETVIRAFGPIGAWAFVYVLDRTTEAYPPRDYVKLDLDDLGAALNVGERQARNVIDTLIEKGGIARDPDDAGRVRVCLDAIERAPARTRTYERKAEAEVRGAQMGLPLVKIFSPEPAAPVIEDRAPESENIFPILQAPTANIFTEPEGNCRKPESYCPWNWSCPHLSSGLATLQTYAEVKSSESSSSVDVDDADAKSVFSTNSFHAELARAFAGAGKSVPTERQSAAVYDAIDGAAFLAWLTPAKLLKANGPGILPSWIEEFRTFTAAAQSLAGDRAAARLREREELHALAERARLDDERAKARAANCDKCHGAGVIKTAGRPSKRCICQDAR